MVIVIRILLSAGLALASLLGGNVDNRLRLPKSLQLSDVYCDDAISPEGEGIGHFKSRPCYGSSNIYESSSSLHAQSEPVALPTTTATVAVTAMPCTESNASEQQSAANADPYSATSTSVAETTVATAVSSSSHPPSTSESHAGSATKTSNTSPPIITGGGATVKAQNVGALGAAAGLVILLAFGMGT